MILTFYCTGCQVITPGGALLWSCWYWCCCCWEKWWSSGDHPRRGPRPGSAVNPGAAVNHPQKGALIGVVTCLLYIQNGDLSIEKCELGVNNEALKTSHGRSKTLSHACGFYFKGLAQLALRSRADRAKKKMVSGSISSCRALLYVPRS